MSELQFNNSLTRNASANPNPSIKDIAEFNETREVRPISGQAHFAKPTLSKRIKDTFVSDDVSNVGKYIVNDIVVPSIRSGIMNSIISAATMVFGGGKPSGYYGPYNNYYRPYNNYSGASYRGPDRYDNKQQYDQWGYRVNNDEYYSTQSYRDVEFISYQDALEAIDELYSQLNQYGMVRVADYFTTARLTGDPQSNNWGWYELPRLVPRPKMNGSYTLDLPKPVPLKR